MSKDFAVLVNIDKWLKSTAGMDADIRGWYFTLLLHQYDKGGLPSNIEDVALLAGVKFSEYKRFEQVFEQVFKQKFICSDDGLLRNPVMDQVLIERNNYKVKREIAGKISYILRYFRKKEGYCAEMDEILKPLVNDGTDTKSEHVLEHLFKFCSEHLRNRNIDINIDSSSNSNTIKAKFQKIETEMLQSQAWIETIAMKTRFSVQQVKAVIPEFILHVMGSGEENPTLADCKQWFNNWAGKNIKPQKHIGDQPHYDGSL